MLLLFDLFRVLDQSILGFIPHGCLLERLCILLIASLDSRELMTFQRSNVLGVAIGGTRGGGERQQEKLVNEHFVFY